MTMFDDNMRLVLGSALVAALGGRFVVMSDGRVAGEAAAARIAEGPPGYAHGGALLALLDEAMGAAAWAAGHRVLAANLNINYRQPVPLGASIQISGEVDRVEGRKVFTRGVITLNGETAAEATGIFVVAPKFFGDHSAGFRFGKLADGSAGTK